MSKALLVGIESSEHVIMDADQTGQLDACVINGRRDILRKKQYAPELWTDTHTCTFGSESRGMVTLLWSSGISLFSMVGF